MRIREIVEALHGYDWAAEEEKRKEPHIDYHDVGPGMVEIEMMHVPPDRRGQGVGARTYAEWEAALPRDIHVVQLWAADTGSGRSNGFWERMGFDYKFDVENGGDEDLAAWMWKGINGHPTPPPIPVEKDEDEEEAGDA